MKEYTTTEVAELVGDTTADNIRKWAKTHLEEGKGYRKIGRTFVLTEAGYTKFANRNTKPGPRTERQNKAA